MKTLLYLTSSAVVIAFAFWAYQVNYGTQDALRRVSLLHAEIAAEREALSVLRAEWAYLNRPDRLRALAEMHFSELGLMPMTAEHFGDPAQIAYPERVLPAEGEIIDALIAQVVLEAEDAAAEVIE